MRYIHNLIILAGLLLAAVSAAQQPVAKQPQPKSQKEVEAIQALFNAPTPEARIQAAEELLKKFADTEFKSVALQVAAAAAQEQNDFEKMVLYSERTLETDPKSFGAMIMLASGIPQRTREFDLDKEEKLAKAEKYAASAVTAVKESPKPRPDITDEQWEGARKDVIAQAHEALGMIALVRKKYDVAITEFKTSIGVAATPDPTTKVRMASAYNLAGKFDEAIAAADDVLADPQLNPVLRQFATQEKLKAAQSKAAATKK